MRTIESKKITKTIAELCIRANTVLRKDISSRLQEAYKKEKVKHAKSVLEAIIKNARVAAFEKLAICQDTGLPCVFVEIGQDVRVKGDIKKAINKGVELGYKNGFLRNSVVLDPLSRATAVYSPAVIHFDVVPGNKLVLTVFPKGFGCENKAQLKMFKPTAELKEIKEFIVDAVRTSGPDACPPYTVGVGIGGTADYACFLAKKALLRNAEKPGTRKAASQAVKLEQELADSINGLRLGPMGLGGATTVLSVHVNVHPTHIAGLPVAVNLSCHALRSASKTL